MWGSLHFSGSIKIKLELQDGLVLKQKFAFNETRGKCKTRTLFVLFFYFVFLWDVGGHFPVNQSS